LLAAALILVGAAGAVLLRDRLALLMASGLVGYGSAVLFLFAGAPDLAFTQFAVETVLVVIAASVLPRFAPASQDPPRLAPLSLVLAIAAGGHLPAPEPAPPLAGLDRGRRLVLRRQPARGPGP
jgi:multicomponent Na+:H+ antiporter subunit A